MSIPNGLFCSRMPVRLSSSTLSWKARWINVAGFLAWHLPTRWALTPSQLLGRLKVLDLEKFISERWNAYWDGRAPGTPVSRRERVNQLYRNHFEATVQRAFAERTLNGNERLSEANILYLRTGNLLETTGSDLL
jgi:hypothetical protein